MIGLREILENINKQCLEIGNCKGCKMYGPNGCIFVGIVNNKPELSKKCIDDFVKMHESNKQE